MAIQYVITLTWLWFAWEFLWKRGDPDFGGRLFFGIFFFVGLACFLTLIYFTVERLQYGDVVLVQDGPVWPGGRLTVVLRIPSPVTGTRTLAVTLQCKRRQWTGSGELSGVTEEVVWLRATDFPISTRAGKSECRVEFDLPDDAPLTRTKATVDGAKQNPGHYWELAVHADVPGIDLMRSFLVSVVARPGTATKSNRI